MYEYNAKVVSVPNGDTIRVIIQLGFKICYTLTIRLYGITAPQVHGIDQEIGRISRDKLRALILNKNVIIKTYKATPDKNANYVADTYLETETGLVCLNDWLVSKKLAKYHKY